MAVNVIDASALSTPTQQVSRTKYFAIEVSANGLKPNTNYNVLYNGTNVDSFCKPFGGNLGAQLISTAKGSILFMFMMAIPYNQVYLVNNINNPNANNIVMAQSSITLQLEDPSGTLITTYIPINNMQA